MLSSEQMVAELARVAYKPGWAFELYDHPFEGPHIFITAVVPNAYREEPLTLGIRSAIPPMRDARALHEWLIWRICRIESHEAREFYLAGGERIFDPHATTTPGGS